MFVVFRWPKLLAALSYAEKLIECFDFEEESWFVLTEKPGRAGSPTVTKKPGRAGSSHCKITKSRFFSLKNQVESVLLTEKPGLIAENLGEVYAMSWGFTHYSFTTDDL